MNKSKFLKKSLAMILSVLMIVAMIPLGASAAETTTLSAIYVDGYQVNASNKVFKAEVSKAQVTVLVAGLNDEEEAYVTKKDGVDTVTVSGDENFEGAPLTLTEFSSNGNVYTIPLTLRNDDVVDTSYSIQLTKVAPRTTTEIAKVEVLEQGLSATVSGRNINVQVPLGYAGEGKLRLTTKDGAMIEGETVVEIEGFDDLDTVDVTSESGNVARYTIRVTQVPVLEAFQAGNVSAKITHDNGEGEGEITATYPTSVMVTPDTEYKAPAQEMKTTYTAIAGATLTLGGEGLKNGDTVDYTTTDDEGNMVFIPEGKELVVTCKGVPYKYTVKFATEADTQNSITAATVDGESATITGTEIKANVQAGAAGEIDYVLVAPYNATVTVTNKSGVSTTLERVSNGDGTGSFAGKAGIDDLKAGLVVVVTSQAGKNKQYSLRVTATGNVSTTELTSFGLVIGGVTYPGTVNKNARTVTVSNVPYLTTDKQLQEAGVIATTNSYAMAAYADSVSAKIEKANDLGLDGFTMNSARTSGTATGKIWAKAKNEGTAPSTEYSITVTLATAKSGNTLTSLVATSANHYKVMTSSNTYTGVVKTNQKELTGTVTINPTFSDYEADAALYLKTIATGNGGVAFLDDGDTATLMPAVLDSKKTTKPGVSFMNAKDEVAIVVLNETEARSILNEEDYTPTKAIEYTVEVVSQEANWRTNLSSLKFGTTTISSALNGTLPYGMTAESEAALKAGNTYYADEVNIALGGKLYLIDEDGEEIGLVVAGGAKDLDTGAALATSPTNVKFGFVRKGDGTVDVYGVTAAGEESATAKLVAKVKVLAENGTDMSFTDMGTIKYAQPNTEAKITAFSVAGANGAIKSDGYDNWAITVTVPLGTKLTTLIPTFTASAGASVVQQGVGPATSGESMMDFTNPVVLIVTSEDEGKVNTYTVTVTAAEGFSDVPSNAWYYNNVMAAYSAGLVSGTGNGKFEPNANITRRDFAILVYKLLGSPTPESNTSFLDVTADDYAATAIACLKEKDIVSGDADTGKFRPAANISRQEAACIVANALNLAGTSETKFTDDAKIASWASAKVYACYAAGVLSGDKDTGNFRPTANITRAEAASIILNASK